MSGPDPPARTRVFARLASRLVFGALLSMAGAIAAALFVTQFRASRVVGDQIDQRAVLLSRSLAQSARGVVEDSEGRVATLADLVEPVADDPEALNQLIEEYRASNTVVIRELHVIDDRSRLLASSRLLGQEGARFVSIDTVLDPAHRSSAHVALNTAHRSGRSVSDVAIASLPEQAPVVHMAQAYDGGTVLVAIDLRQLWPIVDSLEIGNTGHSYLVSESGLILCHPDRNLIGTRAGIEISQAVGREGIVVRTGPRGNELVAAVSPLGGTTQWLAVVEQERSEALAPVAGLTTGAILVFAVSMLAAVPVLALLASSVTRPLRHLADAATRAAGDPTAFGPPSARAPLEVQELASSLRTMSTELAEANVQAERRAIMAEQARALTEVMSRAGDPGELIQELEDTLIGTMGVADHLCLITVAPKTGMEIGMEIGVEIGVPPEGWSTNLGLGAEPGPGPLGPLISTHGQLLPVADLRPGPVWEELKARALAWAVPLAVEVDEHGVAALVVGWRDRPQPDQQELVTMVSLVLVARLKRYYLDDRLHQYSQELEGRVRQRTAHIEQTQAELEAFTATVSHDLRGPMQTIRGFSDVVDLQLERGNTEGARSAAARIGNAVEELADFTDRLLAVAMIGHAGLQREQVDLTVVARAAADEQCQLFGVPASCVTVEEMGTAFVDRALVRSAFDNLLSNAIKYSRPADPDRNHEPRVSVFRSDEGGAVTYGVKDNGPGIDPALLPRVFDMYLRSERHPAEGAGIGLASVKRIVLTHGGSIRAESDPGSGTTVRFSLGQWRELGNQIVSG